MDTVNDLVTIDAARRIVNVSPSAIGYWIVTDQLQATATADGRMVSVSTVRRLAQELNLQALRTNIAAHSDEGAEAPETESDTARPPSTRGLIEGPRVMAEVITDRSDAQPTFETFERQLRLEHRVTALEVTIAALRERVRTQDETLAMLRERLKKLSSASIAPPNLPAHETPTVSTEQEPEEPLLTIRLRPASDPQPDDSGTPSESLAASSRNAPRELPRLALDTEPLVPVSPSSLATPRTNKPSSLVD